MQFFIDTANLEEICKAAKWGILNGVTTNPTLIAREGDKHEARIKAILETFDEFKVLPGWISVETVDPEADKMIEQGLKFMRWDSRGRIVVKVPATPNGIQAAAILKRNFNINTNVTLVFQASQAILAAKAGALFVSPFVGRLDDNSMNGIDLVREIVEIYRVQDYKTKVLAASLRHPLHVIDSAKAGADAATMPFKVAEQLFQHPLTDIGLKKFLEDAGQFKDKM